MNPKGIWRKYKTPTGQNCPCGARAVKRDGSGYVCQRCLDWEKSYWLNAMLKHGGFGDGERVYQPRVDDRIFTLHLPGAMA